MYKGRYFVRRVEYICGEYMDVDIYPVFQKAGRRRRKCKPTSDIQSRLNQRRAEEKLKRLIHNNFSEDDITLTLTYAQEPELDQGKKDLSNFLRCLKRRRKKLGLSELKYITVTEISGKGRVHHHCILSGGMDRDEVEKLWGKGYANSKRLQLGQEGAGALSKYMCKQHLSYRRWNQSKNLIPPAEIVQDGAIKLAEVKDMEIAIDEQRAHMLFESVYPDYDMLEASYYSNGVNHGEYVRISMRRTPEYKKRRTG